jgi:hypothetical protein
VIIFFWIKCAIFAAQSIGLASAEGISLKAWRAGRAERDERRQASEQQSGPNRRRTKRQDNKRVGVKSVIVRRSKRLLQQQQKERASSFKPLISVAPKMTCNLLIVFIEMLHF